MTDENHTYVIVEKDLEISENRLKAPGKILGKNLWVMGPLKETTVKRNARKRDIAPV